MYIRLCYQYQFTFLFVQLNFFYYNRSHKVKRSSYSYQKHLRICANKINNSHNLNFVISIQYIQYMKRQLQGNKTL